MAFKARPAGNAPVVTDHLYGPTPPLACRVALYAAPVVVFVKDVVVITKGGGATVNVNDCDATAAVDAESLTETVMLKDPVAVGVPEMVPVPASSANPVGNAPLVMDQVYGVTPPVACSLAEYAEPEVALVKEVVVMTSGAGADATAKVNA